MKICHVFVLGFVQGVGYRRFVRHHALKLGLRGCVKNLSDNRVEAIFQSSASSDQEAKKQIKKMIEICEKGPFLSEVKDVVAEWDENPQETYETFEIR